MLGPVLCTRNMAESKENISVLSPAINILIPVGPLLRYCEGSSLVQHYLFLQGIGYSAFIFIFNSSRTLFCVILAAWNTLDQ